VRDPGLRLAKDNRDPLAGEDLLSEHFAAQGFAIRLHHRQRFGIEFARHIELRQRPVPLAHHDQQLKQKHAVLEIGRIVPHLVLQLSQRLVEVAAP